MHAEERHRHGGEHLFSHGRQTMVPEAHGVRLQESVCRLGLAAGGNAGKLPFAVELQIRISC